VALAWAATRASRSARSASRSARTASRSARAASRSAERDAVRADREALRAERDALVAAQASATAQRADALDTLAARAEGAVVVLPGVNLPEAEAGPAAPAARVAWRPTWSEWASDDDDVDDAAEPVVAAAPVPATIDVTDDDHDDEGTVRYLNVAATIGQLLPEDLGPLLMAGATVVRREGRLFATVAVTSNPWAASGSDSEQQAAALADAGFRVEWTTDAPLAC